MSWLNQEVHRLNREVHDQEPPTPDAHAAGQVDERLARLLGPGPRHAGGGARWDDLDAPAPDHPGEDTKSDWLTAAGLVGSSVPVAATRASVTRGPVMRFGLRRLLAERFGAWSFGPSQLAVIGVIVLLGLGLTGWSVLRARPVALASGSPAASSSPGSPAATASASTGAVPTAAGPTAAARRMPGAPASSGAPMIKVHVLGAVKHPGVVALPPGSRVQDALDHAGGAKKSAALGDLNLAQPLADGQQVFIARHGGTSEVRDPVAVPPGGAAPAGSGETGTPGSATSGSDGASPAAQPVNLNTATVDELDQLPGVGPVTAQKIIDWRTQHGRFDSPEELQEVDGIGPKTYAEIAPHTRV